MRNHELAGHVVPQAVHHFANGRVDAAAAMHVRDVLPEQGFVSGAGDDGAFERLGVGPVADLGVNGEGLRGLVRGRGQHGDGVARGQLLREPQRVVRHAAAGRREIRRDEEDARIHDAAAGFGVR